MKILLLPYIAILIIQSCFISSQKNQPSTLNQGEIDLFGIPERIKNREYLKLVSTKWTLDSLGDLGYRNTIALEVTEKVKIKLLSKSYILTFFGQPNKI